ncbi:hypothetical protein [Vibrio alginolyticus]|uniref:hypothetical protein n=1 Tax=Vibrio alginolyticus TaxID=663 RepID=UPI00211A4578|nr:hypothetical protein [Vibrio alginolyticus]MCQ9090625.1 hypothetical protein [Vibrio alginolyticus]
MQEDTLMPSYNEINAPFWKNSLHVLQLPDEMPSQREVTWLIEILNAANKLSSKGAVLIDVDDMDNPTADLPDVHVEVDFKDVFTPLRVTCWRAPIPKDATVVVEIKNNAITN